MVYTTVTATLDPSGICDLYHSSRQWWILNPLRPGIEPASSRTLCRALYLLSHNGNAYTRFADDKACRGSRTDLGVWADSIQDSAHNISPLAPLSALPRAPSHSPGHSAQYWGWRWRCSWQPVLKTVYLPPGTERGTCLGPRVPPPLPRIWGQGWGGSEWLPFILRDTGKHWGSLSKGRTESHLKRKGLTTARVNAECFSGARRYSIGLSDY